MVQTKPISESFKCEVLSGKREKPAVGPSDLPLRAFHELLLRTNKPNWPAAKPCRAKQSQFRVVRPASGADCAKQTQFGDRGGSRNTHHSTIPAFPSDTGCTNKPNSARGPAGSLGVGCTNEANLGHPSARRDASGNEQSQFRGASRWRSAHHSIIPSFQHSHPMPVVPNKANRRSRSRQPGYPTTTVCYHFYTPVPNLLCETKPMAPERAPLEGILAACRPAGRQL